MTDTKKSDNEIVNLFDRSARRAARATPSSAPDDVSLSSKTQNIDQQSVKTLNSAIEAVLKGECSGVCIIATGANGLQRFWVSFPKGSTPQIEAIRYLGLTRMFEEVLGQIICDGIETEMGDV